MATADGRKIATHRVMKKKLRQWNRDTITDAVYAAIFEREDATDAQLIAYASKRHGKRITKVQFNRAVRACSRRGLDRVRKSSQMSQPDGESPLVARCLQGDVDALAELYETFHGSLLEILLSRGVDRTEAEDVLADLWADCVPGQDDRPSILAKFSGKCALQDWLATVATIRWVDRKPKRSRHNDRGGIRAIAACSRIG
jgi:hypothetical protein